MSGSVYFNGTRVEFAEGDTILAAAEKNGVFIPTLCHDPDLPPAGVCRVCVVEVEGQAALAAACSTPARDGMRINPDSEKTAQVRKTTLELILSGAGGKTAEDYRETPFGALLKKYGITQSPYPAAMVKKRSVVKNPMFTADFSRCVMCRRCVAVCGQKMNYGALTVAGDGTDSHIATAHQGGFEKSGCVFCGNCVGACPSGALMESWRAKSNKATVKSRTICPYCGTGCGLVVHVSGGRITGVEGDRAHPVSRGDLCVKGRFAFGFIQHKDRLATPMIRKSKGGRLVKASWEEALAFTAGRLLAIRERHGSGAIAGVSSSRCSNEENYIMSKLMRAALGSNNIDNCARVCHAPSVTGLAAAFGSGAATNSLEEIEGAKAVFLAGANATEAHPVIGMRIKKAVANGARLIVADPRRIELARMADIHLPLAPGTNIPLFLSMLNVIIAEGLTDETFIRDRTEGFEGARKSAMEWPPERAAKVTKLKAEAIRAAARMYAGADRAMILYGLGITEHVSGASNVKALANLALATGAVGRPYAGILPLRGQNNVQGACDMGALPNVFPGYQPVADEAVRARFEAAYGRSLSGEVGIKTTEYASAIESGELRALIIMAMDPAQTDPNLNRLRAALGKLEFLAVMEIFPTETTKMADVILPGASFAEKTGTFTNAERRVQLFRQVVDPIAGARPDWMIVRDLSGLLGYPMDYRSPEDIFNEVAALTPDFAGMDYTRLEAEGGLRWPCPSKGHPGTPTLHQTVFANGRARFSALAHIPPKEKPGGKYPLTLVTGRTLQHYNNGSMTRRSRGLMEIAPEERVEVNPADAEKYGVRDGGWARVTSRRGEVVAKVAVTDKAARGRIFMSFHFDAALTNMVTSEGLDLMAGTPEYKVAAVRLEKAAAPGVKYRGAGRPTR